MQCTLSTERQDGSKQLLRL